jgi:Family of unknown function (DUF6166)
MQPTSTLRTRSVDATALCASTAGAKAGRISPALIGRVAPAVTRTGRSPGSDRYYVGRRPCDTEVYVTTRNEIEPLEHPSYRSTSPFDWGSLTPGGLELSFAMLAHTTDSRPPDPICVAFWTDVVACLDRDGFVLCDGDVALWLLTAFCDGDGTPPGRTRSLRRRATGWFRSWLRHS